MDNKFHIQLDEFNLQAINFIKFDNYDESFDSAKSEDKDPKYEVFIEKKYVFRKNSIFACHS